MTSSRRKSSRMKSRFIWLAAAIVAAIALYTFGWFYAADRLVAEANNALTRFSSSGDRAACENVEARGYPFRIGLFCDSIFFEKRIDGLTFDAGAFRSAAQVYAPLQVIAELDGPARVNLPRLLPLHLKWENLRASTRLGMPLPERLSIIANDLTAEADAPGTGATGLLQAEQAQVHLRPAGADADLGLRFDAVSPGPVLTDISLPPVSGVGDIKVIDGVLRAEKRDMALRGTSLEIRQLDLTVEGGGTLTVSGPFSVSADGLINAELQLKASDAAALMAILSESFPEIRSQMMTLGAGLAALGPDQSIPLIVRDGAARLGFIELGRIPPL